MREVILMAEMCVLGLTVWVAAGLFSAGFVSLEQGIQVLRASEYFAVVPERIVIEGNRRLNRDEILLLAGLDRRTSWFDIDERRIGLFIRSNGWIKKSMVQTLFPDRVHIAVEEYEPAIVVNKRETTGERGEALYSMWFADHSGLMFKKAFPCENKGDFPLFFIEHEVPVEGQGALVRQAIALASAWKRHRDICRLRTISYDIVDGFSLECDFPRAGVSRIVLGRVAGDEEIEQRSHFFQQAANRLQEQRLFAAEYFFDERRDGAALVVGRIKHYRDY